MGGIIAIDRDTIQALCHVQQVPLDSPQQLNDAGRGTPKLKLVAIRRHNIFPIHFDGKKL